MKPSEQLRHYIESIWLAYIRKDFIRDRELKRTIEQDCRRIHVQRSFWGSTGTKNPACSDVLYVEELVGPDTVNTVPTATRHAFQEDGYMRNPTLEEEVAEAGAAIDRLRSLGIGLDAITEKLQADGVAALAASRDELLAAIDRKVKDRGQAIRTQKANASASDNKPNPYPYFGESDSIASKRMRRVL